MRRTLLVRGVEIPQGWGALPHHGDKPQQTPSGITTRTTGDCKEESQPLLILNSIDALHLAGNRRTRPDRSNKVRWVSICRGEGVLLPNTEGGDSPSLYDGGDRHCSASAVASIGFPTTADARTLP